MSKQELMRELLAEIRASQVATDAIDQAVADYLGINRTDYRALDVLDQKGRLTAGELAREMHLTSGGVTSVLDRLERAGYARRIRDPDDRRRVLVEASPELVRAGEAIYGRPEEALETFSRYTTEELELLLRFMREGRRWQAERLERIAKLPRRRQGS
jgi:DNA-binding MarR family transcriptional regulator